jgi:hypothetical protein
VLKDVNTTVKYKGKPPKQVEAFAIEAGDEQFQVSVTKLSRGDLDILHLYVRKLEAFKGRRRATAPSLWCRKRVRGGYEFTSKM